MWFQKRTFIGGVHPPEQKSWTERKAIEKLPLPKMVTIPLQQHIGRPSKPIVNVGDTVKVGTPLSAADGFVSVPVHASISGTVTAIEPRPHPLGVNILSVVIESDGNDEISPDIKSAPLQVAPTAEEIKQKIAAAGIAGMGGATFPTHVKLSPPPSKKIDTFILNGAECEPFLTSDHRLMLESPREILHGVQFIMQALGCKTGVIGIENNKPDAIKQMRDTIRTEGLDLKVIGFQVKYPQGAEKQLIKAATGREVPRSGLPMDIGAVVQNVGTAKAVYDAVIFCKPLYERVVTVTGPGIKNPKNVLARIGTPFADLIEFCGGLSETASKILNGGPMMGIAQYSPEVPVIKGTSGIVVFDKKNSKIAEESPCIRCGRCVEVCPMGLIPSMLGAFVEYKKFDSAKKLGVLDCIECGSCAFICPAKRHLVHYIKFGKFEVNRRIQAAAK
jgi:electron transport complex protein RnfC